MCWCFLSFLFSFSSYPSLPTVDLFPFESISVLKAVYFPQESCFSLSLDGQSTHCYYNYNYNTPPSMTTTTTVTSSSSNNITQPKRHQFLHRDRSGSYLSSTRSFSAPSEHSMSIKEYPRVFQGTDAVPQNQRVALQRIIDTHQALELKYEHDQVSTPTSTTSERPTSSCSSMLSTDPFTLDFSSIAVADAELRTFRYLLRLWDSKSYPADPDFDAAIAPVRPQFEERALKHFINRVALWHASTDSSADSMSRSIFAFRRRRRSRAKSVSQALGEDAAGAAEERDVLKEVTTREGLAQLVWTLLHDAKVMSGSGLRDRCMDAMRDMYRMTSTTS